MNNKKFILENARNNSPTLYYLENGIKRYLHSRYEPEKEAEALIKNIDFCKYDFIVIFGNGLGYILRQLISVDAIKKIIVIEKEEILIQKFKEINKEREFEKVDFLTDQLNENIINFIVSRFNLMNYKGFYLVELPSIVAIASSYYNDLKKSLNEALERKINNQLTESHLGISLLNNFFNNIKIVKQIHLLKINKEKSKKKSIVIVSAGPSLMQDIEALKVMQDHILILTVDTALKYLLKNGVIPDMVYSLDPQYYSYFHFYNISIPEKITNVSDVFSGFPLLKSMDFSFIISKNFISNLLFDKDDLMDNTGGSVTNFIFQFVCNYFSEIVMVGLDLCYDSLNMYIPHTYINDFFLKRNKKNKTLQSYYFSFYTSRAKRDITFKNKQFKTTFSMISYYNWLKNNLKDRINVSLSTNCRADFSGIKRIDIKNIKLQEKNTDMFFYKNIDKNNIIKKLQKLKNNSEFMDQLSNQVLFTQYFNKWQGFSDNFKKETFQKRKKYILEKIEMLI